MLKYFEQLREKPVATRKRAALGLSLGIFLIIVLVWAGLSFYPPTIAQPAAVTTAEVTPPGKSIWQKMSEQYAQVKDKISQTSLFKSTPTQQTTTNINGSTASTSTVLVPGNDVIITDPGQ